MWLYWHMKDMNFKMCQVAWDKRKKNKNVVFNIVSAKQQGKQRADRHLQYPLLLGNSKILRMLCWKLSLWYIGKCRHNIQNFTLLLLMIELLLIISPKVPPSLIMAATIRTFYVQLHLWLGRSKSSHTILIPKCNL